MSDKANLNCEKAKEISIVEFLASEGHMPKKVSGNDFYFLSPIRIETDPSFRVRRLNKIDVWWDYGLKKGGNIIDLGLLMFNCTIEELLKRLESLHSSSVQPRIIAEEPVITIKNIKKMSHPALLSYIRERNIKREIANIYCEEVEYYINNKLYYAIGFKNISNGYELRNKYFKGSTPPKNISILSNQSDKLCLFEGFFDFLSYFGSKFEMPGNFDYLVLNSIGFLEKNISIITSYREIYLFLDNDNAGNSGARKLLEISPTTTVDKSSEYKDFKDLNDFINNKKIEDKKSNETGHDDSKNTNKNNSQNPNPEKKNDKPQKPPRKDLGLSI